MQFAVDVCLDGSLIMVLFVYFSTVAEQGLGERPSIVSYSGEMTQIMLFNGSAMVCLLV